MHFMLLLQKFTKNAVEVGRTFSSLMSNIYFRKRLSDATTEQEFKQVLKEQSENYITQARLSLGDEFEEEEEDHSEMGVRKHLSLFIIFLWVILKTLLNLPIL